MDKEFKSYKDFSKEEWGDTSPIDNPHTPSYKELQIGALERIADALEKQKGGNRDRREETTPFHLIVVALLALATGFITGLLAALGHHG